MIQGIAGGEVSEAQFREWIALRLSFDIMDLVAEGDAVVARFTSTMTLATGKKVETRGMTYYRLADGKIVENDAIESPDLTQELAALMAPPSA